MQLKHRKRKRDRLKDRERDRERKREIERETEREKEYFNNTYQTILQINAKIILHRDIPIRTDAFILHTIIYLSISLLHCLLCCVYISIYLSLSSTKVSQFTEVVVCKKRTLHAFLIFLSCKLKQFYAAILCIFCTFLFTYVYTHYFFLYVLRGGGRVRES